MPTDTDIDLAAFLAQPLVARVATVWRGEPRVRPVWFCYEEDAFWWLTGPWSVLSRELAQQPQVELVVDTCELSTRSVIQVRARGVAETRPFDEARAQRWGERYLGPDRTTWGRFAAGVFDDPATTFVRLEPIWLRAVDLSW